MTGLRVLVVEDGCRLVGATLRLHASSADTGRTLQAWRLAGPWAELQVTWGNQPGTTGSAATTASGRGARDWNVTSHVSTMLATGVNHGFLIHDAAEGARGGFEQSFAARELRNRPQLILHLDDD